MCGIVGYVGARDATPLIYNGLRRLEYRGYDSAGIAVIQEGEIQVRRDAGKLAQLAALLDAEPIGGNIGIGHTRWATHGKPNQRNAHPHVGATGEVVVVHNGIVENFLELREELSAEGITFQSETDTEVIVQLVDRYLALGHDLASSARMTINHLDGAHGIVLLSTKEPDRIVAARLGNAGGVVIGVGKGEMFVASDIPAILEHTREMIFLEPSQMAVITNEGVQVQSIEGAEIKPDVHVVPWDAVSAERGEYKHFMLKEIYEQVRASTNTIGGRVDFEENRVQLASLNLTGAKAKQIRKIIITACGTAAHVGMIGKILLERIARIPTEVDIASEFRYRDPIIEEGTVVLAISQSGETADTLAAMAEAKDRGATLWSIVNAIGSQAMRIADGTIPMQAGPEIGVASTKAYTTPLIDLYMLAIYLADLRSTIDEAKRHELVQDLRLIPDLVGRSLDRARNTEKVAWLMKDVSHCLYLGRGINMPTAYEGALKLKEISYIHAEAYPAGEMKHGPIALIDKEMPVIAIAADDPWYDDNAIEDAVDHVLWVPKTPWLLSPVTTIIPLQLLAYHIAVLRGADVDQPRNLAKSVTVE
jgi:glucosamine--fructose-6-phosphate aminotransferase (isomerizing)